MGQDDIFDLAIAAFPIAAGDRLPECRGDGFKLVQIEHREDGRGGREFDDLGRSAPAFYGETDPGQNRGVADDISRDEMTDDFGFPPPPKRDIGPEALQEPARRLDGTAGFE